MTVSRAPTCRTTCWCCRKVPLSMVSIRITATAAVRSSTLPPARACRCRRAPTAASCAGTCWCSTATPARQTLPQTNGTMTPACTAGSPSSRRTAPRPMGPPPPRPAAFPMSRMSWTTGWNWTSPMQTVRRPIRSCTTPPPGRACAATGRPAATAQQPF